MPIQALSKLSSSLDITSVNDNFARVIVLLPS